MPSSVRLFRHQVDAQALDRRKAEPEIRRRGLDMAPMAWDQRCPSLAQPVDPSQPFAVATVEQRHTIARTQPQDAAQVMSLRRSGA